MLKIIFYNFFTIFNSSSPSRDCSRYRYRYRPPCILKQRLLGDLLLYDHTDGGNHRKSSVLELLCLHYGKLVCIRGFQAKGIETDVAGVVVIVQLRQPRLALYFLVFSQGIEGKFPTDERPSEFGGRDGHRQKRKEKRRDLLYLSQVRVRRTLDRTSEQGVELFGNEVSQHREHRNAAVRNLRLAVSLDFLNRKILCETEGIELAEGHYGTRESQTELVEIRRPSVDGRINHFGFGGGFFALDPH